MADQIGERIDNVRELLIRLIDQLQRQAVDGRPLGGNGDGGDDFLLDVSLVGRHADGQTHGGGVATDSGVGVCRRGAAAGRAVTVQVSGDDGAAGGADGEVNGVGSGAGCGRNPNQIPPRPVRIAGRQATPARACSRDRGSVPPQTHPASTRQERAGKGKAQHVVDNIQLEAAGALAPE